MNLYIPEACFLEHLCSAIQDIFHHIVFIRFVFAIYFHQGYPPFIFFCFRERDLIFKIRKVLTHACHPHLPWPWFSSGLFKICTNGFVMYIACYARPAGGIRISPDESSLLILAHVPEPWNVNSIGPSSKIILVLVTIVGGV